MKYVYTLLLFFLFLGYNSMNAQTVYTDLEFPVPDEPVTVYFNATGTPLEDYTGLLYTHTGVGIEGQGNWQNVIGSWGNNTNQPELTSLGNNLWELPITPSIREFYSVSPNAEIINMSFVFRSEDAGTQTSDLFLQVFSTELDIYFVSPTESELTVIENDIIYLEATSPLADSMFLFINDELVYSTDQIVLEYEIVATGELGYWVNIPIDVTATNATDSVTVSGSYRVIPPPTVQPVPDGVTDGVNYINNNTVILSLYAPGKEYAFVIGDFNSWNLVETNYMKKTPDGERYWVQIDGLNAGEEYAYQYLVDGSIKISDPYSELILDPWNDQFIPDATYPDLKPYPVGQEELVSVLQTNQEAYNWQNTDFEAPDKDDLVVYELLVRDFIENRNYQTLIDTLPYLKNLGINAIELMPVNEFDGNLSWGYNPNHFFAVDKFYGTRNDFKAFVDACHGHDIAVILDVVYNHATGISPYVKLYWNSAANRPSADSPFYNEEATHDFNVFYDMNHESPASQEYISRAVKYWLEEYKVDGYRFDLSKGFTQKVTVGNVGAWGQYDQDRIDILTAYADVAWSVNPDAYIILEHFADNSEEEVLSDYGCMLWGNSNYNYNEGTMGYNESGKSDFSWISYQERGWNDPHVVGYMESHDEERLMAKNLAFGNISGSYSVKELTTALERQQLAAAFFFTIPGPKMIWQFGEMGYDFNINYPGEIGGDEYRTDEKPIRWDYLEDYRRKLLYNVYSELIKLKVMEPAFQSTDFALDVNNALKKIHINHETMDVTVVGNFDVNAGSIIPEFQHTGYWYDYFAGDSLEVTDVNASIQLEPGEYRIYTDKKFDRPEIGLGLNENDLPELNAINLYPNPANGPVTINFELNEAVILEVAIYNIKGQQIRTIENKLYNQGNHSILWNVTDENNSRIDPGIYFLEFKSVSGKLVSKLIVQ